MVTTVCFIVAAQRVTVKEDIKPSRPFIVVDGEERQADKLKVVGNLIFECRRTRVLHWAKRNYTLRVCLV